MYDEGDYGSLEGCEKPICRDIIDVKVKDYTIKVLCI